MSEDVTEDFRRETTKGAQNSSEFARSRGQKRLLLFYVGNVGLSRVQLRVGGFKLSDCS